MNIIESKDTESYPNFKRKKRNSSIKEYENITEREFIEDILQTPYEKVLKILGKIMKFLFDSKAEEKMIQELEWVMKKIETNSLYGFEICEQSIKKNNFHSDNLKTFLEYLNIYCEMPETEQSPKLFKSHIVKNISDIEMLHKPQKKNSSSNLQKTYIDSFDDNNDNIINKDFNIFEYEKKVGRSNVLPSIALIAIKNTKTIDLINCLNISPFLEKIRSGYKESNPYHNDMHAADVCQTVLFYLTNNNNELTIISQFKKIDLMSLIIAALIHDLGHPGLTNNYLINTGNTLANTYNDKSVLENFHIAEGFRIMNSFNILSRLDIRQYKKLRKRVIESVLATDLISHAKVYSLMKNKVKGCEATHTSSYDNMKLLNSNSSNLFEEQQDVINFVLHIADISHSSKSFNITSKWTNHIMEEFWLQGDLEKAKRLQVSFLCDRETSDVPRSQIAFIQGIVLPSFDIFSQAVPSLSFLKENILKNLEEWKKAVNY